MLHILSKFLNAHYDKYSVAKVISYQIKLHYIFYLDKKVCLTCKVNLRGWLRKATSDEQSYALQDSNDLA